MRQIVCQRREFPNLCGHLSFKSNDQSRLIESLISSVPKQLRDPCLRYLQAGVLQLHVDASFFFPSKQSGISLELPTVELRLYLVCGWVVGLMISISSVDID